MKLKGIELGKAFKLAKDGRTPVRDEKRLDLISQIKQRSSKRVKVKKREIQDFRG